MTTPRSPLSRPLTLDLLSDDPNRRLPEWAATAWGLLAAVEFLLAAYPTAEDAGHLYDTLDGMRDFLGSVDLGPIPPTAEPRATATVLTFAGLDPFPILAATHDGASPRAALLHALAGVPPCEIINSPGEPSLLLLATLRHPGLPGLRSLLSRPVVRPGTWGPWRAAHSSCPA